VWHAVPVEDLLLLLCPDAVVLIEEIEKGAFGFFECRIGVELIGQRASTAWPAIKSGCPSTRNGLEFHPFIPTEVRSCDHLPRAALLLFEHHRPGAVP
jgi:hypothetical protein